MCLNGLVKFGDLKEEYLEVAAVPVVKYGD